MATRNISYGICHHNYRKSECKCNKQCRKTKWNHHITLSQRPLDVLQVLRVHSPGTVDTPCNLVDVDADLLQLCGLREDGGGVDMNDIAVDQRLPGVWLHSLCLLFFFSSAKRTPEPP